MEAAWLAAQLEAGRSIESIARETGRAPSTVAYWVNKHGLTSQHATRHRAEGPIARERLEALVQDGRSIREIATELGVSAGTVRHWLGKHGLGRGRDTTRVLANRSRSRSSANARCTAGRST
jgi:transposase-like protein